MYESWPFRQYAKYSSQYFFAFLIIHSTTGHQSVTWEFVWLKFNSVFYKKNTLKSEKAYLVYFAVFSWILGAPESRFERFISQRLVHMQHIVLTLLSSTIYYTWASHREINRSKRLSGAPRIHENTAKYTRQAFSDFNLFFVGFPRNIVV